MNLDLLQKMLRNFAERSIKTQIEDHRQEIARLQKKIKYLEEMRRLMASTFKELLRKPKPFKMRKATKKELARMRRMAIPTAIQVPTQQS